MSREFISGHYTIPQKDTNSSSRTDALEKLLQNTTICCGLASSYNARILLHDMLTSGRALIRLKISSGGTPSITLIPFREYASMKGI